MADRDFSKEYTFAQDLARKAGDMIEQATLKRWADGAKATAGPEEKLNSVDLVTETDQAVEALIKDTISKTYPDHKFIGEETFAAGEKAQLTDEPTWIVDPIDGTTNFIHGMTFGTCVSIGMTYNKVPTIGIIYNPADKKMWRGLRGNGSFLEIGGVARQLPLSHPNPLPLRSLGESQIGVEWGSLRDEETLGKKTRSFTRLTGDPKSVKGGLMAQSLRSLGCASLHYTQVATGAEDIYWEIGCYSWDVCAGIVIAKEAGGQVYGKSGRILDGEGLMGRHFLVIRGIGDTPNETGAQAQQRLVKDFFEAIEEWDP